MDTELSEEHCVFRDMFRDFAQNEVAPFAATLDREERSPVELLRKAAKLDLLGIPLPQRFGGVEAGILTYGLLLEELGKACPSTAVALNAHCTTAVFIAGSGTEEQKQTLLPALASGEIIAATARAEPEGDPHHMATTVHRLGERWGLRGCKCDVILGDVADVLVVTARMADHLGAFVVAKDAPGLVIGWRNRQMGLCGAAGSMIFFDDCILPDGALLGDVGTDIGPGLAASRRLACLGLAFVCLGLAERCLADSLSFAQSRHQFGGPIANKHAIQNHLGDMATYVETLRRLAYQTAKQGETGTLTDGDVATLHLWANQVGLWVVNKTVQIHGGMGYVKDYHVERLYRDMRTLALLEGTPQQQRLAVAAHALASRER